MAEWYVSGSESDNEGGREEGEEEEGRGEDDVNVGGLRIETAKVVEIFRAIGEKSLKLECLSDVKKKERAKRGNHRPGSAGVKVHSPANARIMEEISETVSEIRSSASTECRDTRRPSLATFDYFHEDFPALAGNSVVHKKKRPPVHRKDKKKLASLDGVVADLRRQEREERKRKKLCEISADDKEWLDPTLPSPVVDGLVRTSKQNAESRLVSLMDVDEGMEERKKEVPTFNFDDSESESPTSDVDMKFSVLSQINRVEQLLDAEGFS